MLLKEKLQAIPIVKTTKSLIKDRVEDLSLSRLRETFLLKKIRESNSSDIVFLLILPIILWPAYFIYRKRINFWCKKISSLVEMPKIEEIRRKVISDYIWIKKVIDSAETADHLNSCRMLIETWSGISSNSIRDYKCPFFKTKEITKTIEAYTRARRDLNVTIANKSVILGNHRI